MARTKQTAQVSKRQREEGICIICSQSGVDVEFIDCESFGVNLSTIERAIFSALTNNLSYSDLEETFKYGNDKNLTDIPCKSCFDLVIEKIQKVVNPAIERAIEEIDNEKGIE